MNLHPWAEGPFELIFHGELHYRTKEDFDRRVALISFDNAIEVSIVTYLSLNPIQRQGRSYERAQVEQWIKNFHTKLDFWDSECTSRELRVEVDRTYMVWYHDLRNSQYHRGNASTPNLSDLQGLRNAALWVFSTLYDVPDIEAVLEQRLLEFTTPPESEENRQYDDFDRVLDEYYGDIELAGGIYKTSEILFRTDPEAYREKALELIEAEPSRLRVVS